MDYNLFQRTLKFADNYKMSQINIYFFIKDCLFKRIFKANNNRFPTQDSQNMFNSFQMEMKQAQWQRNFISKNEYQNYLEDLFKRVDFNTIDWESCEILKILTENNGIFGAFDNLTTQRLQYFNKKIEKFKSNQGPQKTTSIFSIFPKQKPKTQINPQHQQLNYNQPPQNIPVNNPNSNYQVNPTLDLPDINKKKEKKGIDPEMARLNEIMKQMKLNSPIYITNVQPGQFYNPYTMPNYIPRGVNTNIPLPMRKKDPNYPNLRKLIEKELILANQELDYHKIDMARNHLEIAAFYLKNVIV